MTRPFLKCNKLPFKLDRVLKMTLLKVLFSPVCYYMLIHLCKFKQSSRMYETFCKKRSIQKQIVLMPVVEFWRYSVEGRMRVWSSV